MRRTIVPAQVTTLEDKIAGRLGLSQMLLLVSPIFAGSAIFVILPPFFNYATYKVVLIVCVASFCGTLAIRIRGKILLFWAIILLRYNLRPRFYVFDKNSPATRDISAKTAVPKEDEDALPAQKAHTPLPQLSIAEIVKVERLITDPNANVHFKTTKKGALSVHFTEVKQESVGAPAD